MAIMVVCHSSCCTAHTFNSAAVLDSLWLLPPLVLAVCRRRAASMSPSWLRVRLRCLRHGCAGWRATGAYCSLCCWLNGNAYSGTTATAELVAYDVVLRVFCSLYSGCHCLHRVGLRRPLGTDFRRRRYWALGHRGGCWQVFVEAHEGSAWGWYEGAGLIALVEWLKAGGIRQEVALVKTLEATPIPRKFTDGGCLLYVRCMCLQH